MEAVGGTTSAYAEKRPERGVSVHCLWNYLRIRGEKRARRAYIPPGLELPPHTRRKEHPATHAPSGAGTTSAYAEKSTAPTYLTQWVGNYLRIRGEKRQRFWISQKTAELPPHTRRKGRQLFAFT
ncbi:Hypothetical protein CUL131002_1770c [Corynebacterium ulcerans]|nr:Hypothetical protein CUL131002_1770c [Corynebacterium ulcerans]